MPTDTTSSQHRDDNGLLTLSALCKDFLNNRGCNVDVLLQALVALQRITDRLLLRHGLASSPTGFKCRLVQMCASLRDVLVHVDTAGFAEEVGRKGRERPSCSEQLSGSLSLPLLPQPPRPIPPAP